MTTPILALPLSTPGIPEKKKRILLLDTTPQPSIAKETLAAEMAAVEAATIKIEREELL